ncbi:hypothetical protein [Cohnella zeiphila]|uniref:Uncharacterized protein n=1 Tax=Cohnella zeiphila TaxID=2761120 RepID=A0A7X0VX60_9BACL|nr:hypothetical protein [Cohnella zeiphila]MBB6731603.1 hypothetical protein [Cohnella zeiphila]
MDITDVSNVSPGLFVTGIIFILLVGSLLSLGVLSFFQRHKRRGSLYFAGSVLSFVLMLWVVNRWFA